MKLNIYDIDARTGATLVIITLIVVVLLCTTIAVLGGRISAEQYINIITFVFTSVLSFLAGYYLKGRVEG